MLTLEPTPTKMPALTPRESAVRAIGQLVAVIVGGKTARITDSLRDQPRERVQKCIEIALAEYQMAAAAMAGSAEGEKKVAQVQRKLDSLQSMAILANVIEEVEWD